jgi:hypothetical protein
VTQPKRFRCPACLKVYDLKFLHGNTKTLKMYCGTTGKHVVMKRVIYRKG